MVIEVETSSSGMPSNAVRMSSSVSIATPVRPTSPRQRGSSESRPSCVGRSKAMLRPGGAVLEQVLVALVGLLGRRVARVLAHRPQRLRYISRVHAARVRELARAAEVEVVRQVLARVQRLDLDARVGEAARVVGADDRRDGEIRRRVLVLDGHGSEGTLPGGDGRSARRCRRSTRWPREVDAPRPLAVAAARAVLAERRRGAARRRGRTTPTSPRGRGRGRRARGRRCGACSTRPA